VRGGTGCGAEGGERGGAGVGKGAGMLRPYQQRAGLLSPPFPSPGPSLRPNAIDPER